MSESIRNLARKLGPLRIILLVMTLLVIAATPWADGRVHIHDWRLLPSVIAPSLMMMIAFTLPLDITMSRLFMLDADAAERRRLWFVIRFQALLLLAMLLAWMPFILRVIDFWPFD